MFAEFGIKKIIFYRDVTVYNITEMPTSCMQCGDTINDVMRPSMVYRQRALRELTVVTYTLMHATLSERPHDPVHSCYCKCLCR